jgi:hypothetical protein
VAVAVVVGVIAPVVVIALVNGNDIVDLIDAVNDSAQPFGGVAPTSLPGRAARSDHGVGHAHGVVPVHERGHDHGTDHAHDHAHVHDHVTSI